MKKILTTIFMMLTLLLGSQFMLSSEAEAADIWVYNDNGKNIYVTYESVIYGRRTSFYAKARVKTVSSSGNLISDNVLEFNQDEGDWWYGITGSRNSKRVYDYNYAIAILDWLKAHKSEAHQTSRMTELALY